jgi:hypothetical protein
MDRIEHPLVDEGRSSTPFDLRPSPAKTAYHKKLRTFQSAVKKARAGGSVLGPRPVNDGAVTVRTRPCDVRLSYTPQQLLVPNAFARNPDERTFSAEHRLLRADGTSGAMPRPYSLPYTLPVGSSSRSMVYSEQRSRLGEKRSMNRVVLIALAGLLMAIGCSKASSPAERQDKREGIERAQKLESPSKLAKYHVTEKKTCQVASQTTKCYSVSTDAKSRKDFTALTQHFRDQSADVDAVVVAFFFDKPRADSSGTGFAFNNEETARNILSEILPEGANLNEEVNKAMRNDGVYVVTLEDATEQEVCENWEAQGLGPPPEEWECPGY